jgi:hypothetical protein
MIIKKSLPNGGYAKISNKIFTNKRLSHGAIRLYGYLCTLPNGKTFVDKDIMKNIGVSQPMLTRWKKELKDENLILTIQLAPRIYDLYVGHPDFLATCVKREWEEK